MSERYAYKWDGDQTQATLPAQAPGQDASGERHYTGSRITKAGRTHYQYDAQGRLVERRTTTFSGKTLIWFFTWDAEDRLTHVRAPGGSHWRTTPSVAVSQSGAWAMKGTSKNPPRTAGTATSWPNSRTTVSPWCGTTWSLQPLAQREFKADEAQEEIDRRFFAIVAGALSELIRPDGTPTWRGRSTASRRGLRVAV
ncbi:hypothetical protein AR457_34325 [Streptomyces agglomeratus]|uniref:RHS repeat domain-containing protein n=1 Tax=Streptomyces agglomeratus TaxID=285458 RepID=UPI00085269ED|nr:RHS repeat domain-containing protein [Streptomyces agglomeratus]OEJ37099.1 hypothetical protein BGK70_01825 [Streptomyces agglomeratus]OEJ48451.1 hypothetical protein AR457_34325 [Streptomyces agglomeratus]